MYYQDKNKMRKGLSLLDVLLALGVSALMFANIAQMQNTMTNNLHSQAIANEMLTLANAARTYITANATALSKVTNGTIEVPITGNTGWNGIGDLQSTGMLPENFTTNLPMGQTVHLLLRQVAANGNIPQHLDAMLVSSGGGPMNDSQVGLAMAKMGGNGGGIMKNPPPGVNTSNIQGSFASWTSPISSWSNGGVPISYGHIAMNLSATLSPVAEWLNRYNTGNPEANTMHTNINMNNFSLGNTLGITGVNNNDLYIGNGTNPTHVTMYNGMMACSGNATGCGVQVSDDGGFYDYNDGWIELTGQYNQGGLRLAGNGNNLDVKGQTIAEQGATVSDANGIRWMSNPAINGAVEASATYDGQWINVVGGSGSGNFQGLYANILKTSKVLDANNSNYYVVPSGRSYLSSANFSGNIGTNNYDAYNGLPPGWGGGVHTWDVYAEATVAVGSSGQLSSYMNNNGFTYMKTGCALILANGSGGCLYSDGKNLEAHVAGTNGTSGGANTFNIKDSGGNYATTLAGGFFASNNSEVLAMVQNNGSIYNISSGNQTQDTNVTTDVHSNQSGNIVNDGGKIVATNGAIYALDGGAGNGTVYAENNVVIGQNYWGTRSHISGNNNNLGGSGGPTNGGGALILKGNQTITGSIKFNFGIGDGTTDSGGIGEAGAACGVGNSTGPGSIAFNSQKTHFVLCGADNQWHQIATTDHYSE